MTRTKSGDSSARRNGDSSSGQGPIDSLGERREVTVVGAGFSGLVAAFHLDRAGFKVSVVEQSERAGGLISTLRTPQGLVETAANGLLNSAAVEDLFAAVGVELMPTLKASRKRFIFRNGRPRRWPLGIVATLRLAVFVLRYFFSRKSIEPHTEEPVRKWARRAMGEEASSYTVEAALQGIYAGDPGRMSARLLFGRFFFRQEPKVRRKTKTRGTVSAPEGMGQLIEALHRYLVSRGVAFEFGTTFSIDSTPSKPVVVATSSREAARLLERHSPERSKLLGEIELLPVVSATCFFRDTDPGSRGFGCLFPPVERRRALGVLKNDFIFAGRAKEGHSENWILGGAANPTVPASSDQEILKVVHDERRACFGGRTESFAHVVTRWPAALPHYTTELEKALPRLNGVDNNVILIGNYLGQIGLAKILERAERLPFEISISGRWT